MITILQTPDELIQSLVIRMYIFLQLQRAVPTYYSTEFWLLGTVGELITTVIPLYYHTLAL